MNENFGGMNNGTVEKKEFKKKKLFESYDDSMNIDYVAEQAKLTKSLTRIKIGIVLGIVSLLFWIINAEVDVSLDQITENVALWSGLVAYIIGGSIRWVFKFVKFCANVAYLIAPGFFTGVAFWLRMCYAVTERRGCT